MDHIQQRLKEDWNNTSTLLNHLLKEFLINEGNSEQYLNELLLDGYLEHHNIFFPATSAIKYKNKGILLYSREYDAIAETITENTEAELIGHSPVLYNNNLIKERDEHWIDWGPRAEEILQNKPTGTELKYIIQIESYDIEKEITERLIPHYPKEIIRTHLPSAINYKKELFPKIEHLVEHTTGYRLLIPKQDNDMLFNHSIALLLEKV